MPKQRIRKHYSAAQKAQIVVELLMEEKTLAQLAAEHKVHVNLLRRWKAQALAGLPSLFETDPLGMQEQAAAHAREKEELYAEIGRLSTQLNWLKVLVSTRTRAECLVLATTLGSPLFEDGLSTPSDCEPPRNEYCSQTGAVSG